MRHHSASTAATSIYKAMMLRHNTRILANARILRSYSQGVRMGNCNSLSTELTFDDGTEVCFNNLFLRDSCTAPESVETNSKQKLFTTAQITDNCKLNDLPVVEGDQLKIDWYKGNGSQPHRSSYPLTFLKDYATQEGRRRGRHFDLRRTVWNDKELDRSLINFQYDQYLTDDATFYKALLVLNKYGLIFINDIPEQSAEGQEWYITKIANRIGYIRETFYGKLFDVKSIPKAKNIAYTSYELPLHMDLLYYESPPGLQLLHSIKNQTSGGENVFADAFQAASQISELDPLAYMALKTVPIAYHYHNDNEYYYHTHPLIQEDETYTNLNGKQPIKEVSYSPQFQAPFDCKEIVEHSSSGSILKDFLRGFKLFESLINDPANQYQLKLPENTCVIFDNRRVLHSRKAFQQSDRTDEERWLKGCYLDTDTFLSRLRAYYERFNKAKVV